MSERIAIIGAGVMGVNHARTVHGLHSEAELVAVVDQDIDRAGEIADEYDMGCTRAFSTIDNISSDNTDIAVIATPSHLHQSQSIELMKKGVHVLVEKPAAIKSSEVDEMDRISKSEGMVLMVGHIELFNPVVKELISVIGDRAIRSMRFKRLGSVDDPARLYHDVVKDLMLHDISIADAVVGPRSNVEVISAFGRMDTDAFPDPAEAILDFGNGIDVQLRASRAFTGGKVRTIEVETEEGVFDADLLTRNITQRSGGEGVIAPNGTYVQDIRTSSHFANGSRQPLELELMHMLNCVRGISTPEDAKVSISDAKRILQITESILEKTVLINIG